VSEEAKGGDELYGYDFLADCALGETFKKELKNVLNNSKTV